MKEEHLEVRRRHGPTLLERLRWHVGTAVAIAAGVLLVLQIFGLALRPLESGRKALRDLVGAIDRVQASVESRTFPSGERMLEVEAQVGGLRTELKHHGNPVKAGEGFTYPPAYLATLKPGESNEFRFQAPVDVAAAAEAGGVDLKWADPANNNVKIGAFEIFRREDGGEATLLKRVDGATHGFRDTSAKPGHGYEYAVEAIASDPDFAETPRGRSPRSAPAAVKAVADFKIELVDLTEGVATLKISKWIEGKWRDRTFDVREGEAIGQMDQALGVDFSTGRRLSKLSVETAQVPVTRDEIVFDPSGRVVVEQGSPKHVRVTRELTRQKISASITGGSLPDDLLEIEKD